MYYPRLAEERIKNCTRFFPVVVVTGARQSGKTTLLKRCFPNFSYVSLDLPSRAEQAERNPGAFLREFSDPVIIDEVQYAPALFRHLKLIIDGDRIRTGRFLLTGSQHFSLMGGVSESLAGRIGIVTLENLALPELSPVVPPPTSRDILIRCMTRGQFPELWRVRDFPVAEFYSAYLATYLERDVRGILNVTSLRDFERFLRVLAARSGSMLNKSDVARDIGVSVKAVTDWIGVLQTSGQIALLEPWFTNIAKRAVKTPKLYFCDTGLLCALLNLTADTLPSSPFLGAVWETFVYAELRKRAAMQASPAAIWYYRDQRSREIDFVIERGGALSFVEAKWQEHPNENDARTIRTLSQELDAADVPWRPGHHYVIGTPHNAYELSAGVKAIGIDGLDEVLRGDSAGG